MQASLEHMDFWTLIIGASPVVKGIMAILLLASLASWYLIVLRHWALARTEAAMVRARRGLEASQDLAALGRTQADDGPARLLSTGLNTYQHLRPLDGSAPVAALEASERAMGVLLVEEELRLERGLSLLATIGSVSPYIGLLGTVWGIMGDFMGLSQAQQATLATVAPGIAEALIATAIGLFAAIPAVIAYNRFAARGQRLLARYYNLANQLQASLHRQWHGSHGALAKAA